MKEAKSVSHPGHAKDPLKETDLTSLCNSDGQNFLPDCHIWISALSGIRKQADAQV